MGKLIVGVNDLYTWCKQNDKEYLLSEWNYELNAELGYTPSTITAHNGNKVHWNCPKCGGTYPSRVSDRTNGIGCPICSGKIVIKGINDLETYCRNNGFEYLLDEWDYEKNSLLGITPNNITAGSGKCVYWNCPRCGNNYKANVHRRISGHNCKKCNSRGTSFAEQSILYYLKPFYSDITHRYTDLGMELDIYVPSIKAAIEYDGILFHNDKNNNEIKKNNVCKDNNITLIRIREDGLCSYDDCVCIFREDKNTKKGLDIALNLLFAHLLLNDIDVDTQRDYAKIRESYHLIELKNSIVSTHPKIAKEWHPTLNGRLNPKYFSHGCTDKFWWLCPLGHSYQSTIADRVNKDCGCSVCSGHQVCKGFNDLETWCKNNNRLNLLGEWCYELNDKLGIAPDGITHGSHKEVYWKCSKCNHIFPKIIKNRTLNNQGCSKCNGGVPKKVKCIETGVIYQSATEANKHTKIDRHKIADCCKGKQKTAGGYHWQYVE